MKSVSLPYCYICGAKFIPEGTSPREDHHIVPRAYGGEKGPTVSICDGCHTKIHAIQNCLKTNAPYFSYLKGMSPKAVSKLLYFANVAYNAYNSTLHDKNKRAIILIQTNTEGVKKLEYLKKLLNLKSRASVYQYAVDKLYHTFTTQNE